MLNDWIALSAMAIVAILIPFSLVLASKALRPSVPEKQKSVTYESGEQPTGDTRINFNIQYYLLALMFVIFDVETVLIYPWVTIFAENTGTYLVAFVFIVELTVGLGWAWKNGAMEWIKPVRQEAQK